MFLVKRAMFKETEGVTNFDTKFDTYNIIILYYIRLDVAPRTCCVDLYLGDNIPGTRIHLTGTAKFPMARNEVCDVLKLV